MLFLILKCFLKVSFRCVGDMSVVIQYLDQSNQAFKVLYTQLGYSSVNFQLLIIIDYNKTNR